MTVSIDGEYASGFLQPLCAANANSIVALQGRGRSPALPRCYWVFALPFYGKDLHDRRELEDLCRRSSRGLGRLCREPIVFSKSP
jgi:hypothetical protein